MTITEKSIKLLWSNAAGRCSFTDCEERLTVEQAANSAPYTLGEMAHIKGEREGSNRYDKAQTTEQRDSYENLILLCPNHHTLIDKPENENIYTVDVLTEMKIAHENSISKRLGVQEYFNIEEVKGKITICLAENREAWLRYGPISEIAQKNPNSEEIYAIWTSERLSTIVPNNRIIVSILEAKRSLFDRQDQTIISEFLSHAKSYEKWVRDEIPYQAVIRFPTSFEHLIMGS
jgi:HNH endonuclease